MTAKKQTKKLEAIVYLSWEESERDWGTRPDGCSLHLSEEDFREYEKDYWKREHEYQKGGGITGVPYEYSRPAGKPVIAYASPKLYAQIKKSKHGIRLEKWLESEAAKAKDLIYGPQRSGWVEVTLGPNGKLIEV